MSRRSRWDAAAVALGHLEPEARLWLAVVLRTLSDLERPPGSESHESAAATLAHPWFDALCELAGLDSGPVRNLGRRLVAGERPGAAALPRRRT